MSQELQKILPDVSVLIPSYNHAPFIEKCLKSIFEQTLHPKKLLVIDDGSKDDSPQIIEKLLKDCPFESELVVRENRGLCVTLNEGFAKTSGEFFAYVGSDDFWMPTFLEERVKLLVKRPSAVLGYGHSFFIDEKDSILDSTENYSDSWANYPDGDPRSLLLQGISPISSTICYRRTALEKVRWNETSVLEDYEMYLQIMKYGEFAFDSQILSVWRQHSYNTSKNIRMLLDEVINAQNRIEGDLDIEKTEFEHYQVKTKFRFARDFLQNGHKKEAFQLAKESWRGANSNNEIANFLFRMLVPMGIINFRRKIKMGRG
ncbi:MAG: glycosyltransferase family A protein [Acidobacteriota bacterium]